LSRFVLDASVTMSWLLEPNASEALDELLVLTRTAGAAAPTMWVYETANVMARVQDRGRASSVVVREFSEILNGLPIFVDPLTASAAYRIQLMDLALSTGLSGYDAAYLEVAERLGLPLATLDRDLRKAAARRGVMVWPDLA
jgi:predicted nucleic acid-binding protein